MITKLLTLLRKAAMLVCVAAALSASLVAYTEPQHRTPSLIVALVFALLAFGCRRRAAPTRARSKALYTTLYALADAVEDKEATIDASIKAVFRDIRDSIESLADDTEDEEVANELADLAFDLTRIVGEDRSEAQVLAHNKRVAAKSEIMRQLKARRASIPPRA